MVPAVKVYLFDPLLDELIARPFLLARPARQSTPFIFASPHSGHLYPESFLAQSVLEARRLRFSEDAFVDDLFAFAPSLGAPLLAARFPRAFVDANRAAGELDATMFDALPALPLVPRTARVAAGLGVIPRIVRDGLDIYFGHLPAPEAAFRLDNFYRPYHAALSRLVHETHARFGVAIVVDCHSMPSGPRTPDIVIGDQYGTSASPSLTRHVRDALRMLGFSVACNAPYAGGHTTEVYGNPALGLHALQIEINRALYLDEERIEKRETFTQLKAQLETFGSALLAADISVLAAPERERERA
ncbi:MAG: N-formylglutamate amidohydrolase [Alphaproteobacteria bacterium]